MSLLNSCDYEKPIEFSDIKSVLESGTAGIIGGYVWNKVWKSSIIKGKEFNIQYAMNEDVFVSK